MSTVIKVENLGKQYRLGEVGTGTLSHDLNRWWARMRGKEDPFAKIGESNDRTQRGDSEYVWSLKEINFEVQAGEVLGIIGRNGAGKSTLLKILSKVTKPTTGQIKTRGRIASLLEVGTGFHPEMTGRENVFLNGAIMGMTSNEIRNKFDEIVDFSGVERYIDTPVKRYSSGMYVRLAFAVAAYLEPEILVVDEVLAVGDAEFQKKCLGKMKDVSVNEGKTVLFVSHSMDAVMRLCTSAILLKNGKVETSGITEKVINYYLQADFGATSVRRWEKVGAPGNEMIKLLEVFVHDENFRSQDNFDIVKMVGITMKYEVLNEVAAFTHGMNLFNSQGINIFNSHDVISEMRKERRQPGNYSSTMWIPGNLLPEGIAIVGVAIFNPDPFYLHLQELDAVAFNVYDNISGESARGNYVGGFPGVVRPILQWSTLKI